MTSNHPEYQYLKIVKECVEEGILREDRTGTGSLAVVGKSMRFSLENNTLPLLTTKFVPFRVVLEELLFFIRGQTDNKILREKKVHIWDGNSTKEFFEKNGINREADDLGPIYGFQWRHFGAGYRTCDDSYVGEGVDQLQNVIDALRNNPNSRRHVVVAWNPTDLKQMALPPCHCLFQFVALNGKLSTIMYQRSADMGLGVPFNIASYSLLAFIVAKLTGLEPYEFIHFLGDTHVYSDHVDALKVQLERDPRPFPTLTFADKEYKDLNDFDISDFILEGYDPHPKISMVMSV
ncbi:thymidylate synthase [Pancytospora epiphaga]|nr:thymidylate synthase [Pancytospora epiphaga]